MDWTTKPTNYTYKGHGLFVRKAGVVEVLPFWADWLLDAPLHVATSPDLAMKWVDAHMGD